MKKTFFVTMLAAALMGGQVFAEVTGTAVEGYEKVIGTNYYGKYSEDGDATGGNVTIKADAQGDVYPEAAVGGGRTGNGTASGNTVTISGGMVSAISGGESTYGATTLNTVNLTGGYVRAVVGGSTEIGDATYNTVTITADSCADQVLGGAAVFGNASCNTVNMSGGNVTALFGGYIYGMGDASGNTVYITAGIAQTVAGGLAYMMEGCNSQNNKVVMTGGEVGVMVAAGAIDGEVSGNEIHLVGKGASFSVDDTTIYKGSQLEIQSLLVVKMVEEGNVHDNSVNVYGTGIQIGTVGTGFQILNFHLLADPLASTAPMVTITEADGFSISNGVDLSFDAVEGMEWKPGDSVTLMEAQKGMSIAQEVLAKEYDIYLNGDPSTIVATAKLTIEQGQGDTQFLKLTVPAVPEPTTGTLSLLALAGLAARRRRK